MFKSSKSKSSICMTCDVTGLLSFAVGIIALVFSIVGVWMAHFGSVMDGAVFGTMSGSLSLMALVASVYFVKKTAAGCCGCNCAVPSKK